MTKTARSWWLVALLLGACLLLAVLGGSSQAEEPLPSLLTGLIEDSQGVAVRDAKVTLHSAPESEPLSEVSTQPDGRYALFVPEFIPDALTVHIERVHFDQADIELTPVAIEALRAGQSVVLPDTVLPRRISPAFWVATLIFLGMLVVIAAGKLHNTLAALVGTSLVFAVSYLGPPLVEDLFIFDFPTALSYVDWNVIFLIMGMMIVIAVVERTGIFQWLAYQAYRLSRGRLWLLLPILMVVTGVASAFLDNVTTMLLMTPITVQIAMAMGISPLALLIPIVMASNVVGVSTLVGTPTNILIGSYARISFSDFLVNLTPGCCWP